MATLQHAFESAYQLSVIETQLSGPETATLTETDYSESGSGPYTYTAEVTVSTEGDYEFTITGAEISDGTSVTWGGPTSVVTYSETTVIDNFEEPLYEDEGNTLSDYYSGDVGNFDRNTNSPVYEGSYSLKSTTSDTENSMYSTSGLPAYPSRGDTFQTRHHLTSTENQDVFFGGPDIDNCYQLTIFDEYESFNLYEVSSGSATALIELDPSVPTGEWIYTEVDYQDPTITITLYDASNTELASDSVDDTTHTGTGFGWGTDENGTMDIGKII